jgi:hypothetical protein
MGISLSFLKKAVISSIFEGVFDHLSETPSVIRSDYEK